jgi:hypothetical protein
MPTQRTQRKIDRQITADYTKEVRKRIGDKGSPNQWFIMVDSKVMVATPNERLANYVFSEITSGALLADRQHGILATK